MKKTKISDKACFGPHNEYEAFPHVILAEMVKKQSWYKKQSDKINIVTKESFEKNHYKPSSMNIIHQYDENQTIEISVGFWDEENRFRIELQYPNPKSAKRNGIDVKVRSQCSAETYSGALNRIQTVLNDGIKICSVKSEEERIKKENEKVFQEKVEEIKKRLETVAPITKGESYSLNTTLYFNEKGNHRVEINLNDKNTQNDCFFVNVMGTYSIDGLKRIIEAVSGGPDYTIERLTKN